ncbi:dicarboxylate/amino acid:cation symporter [Romboutsia lituseburensis]|uniref:dicarboxylate/amino acid:cation symporter n=1 Tax=Romboutsia lituseburensis TaxID=1537 RepID=UPI00215B5920|nr:dicarboxylate/amino acid:cation symporter [Romboutsia lituseburensis]MCR8746679.1 dicarboxylate/amino acid:cation symporter [Romboutsia lituseburensis]
MKKQLGLTSKIFIGILLGAILGLILKSVPDGTIKNTILLDGLLKVMGSGFINAIKMLVVPLVFISLVCGSSSMGDVKKLGRIGIQTFCFYLVTTAIAISLALVVGKLINPGIGLDMSNLITQKPTIGESKPLVEVILSIIPTNPIQSLANGEMLQIILFSLLLGVSMSVVGKKADPLRKLFESANEVCMKMVSIIMLVAPYGVFALIANTFATTGFDAIFSLLKYMFAVSLALILQVVIVYSGMVKVFTGLKLKPFFKKFAGVAAVTFSTASSNAALPLTIESMEELGVDNSVASFTLPLGATINMDGTAIMQGVACVFIAQLYGIDLGINSFLTIILTATLASVGTAGVPGVGMITLSMVLTSVGLPIEGVGLIMGVDRLLDMARTTINVMGDCACTLVVSNKEGELDKSMYYKEFPQNSKISKIGA